MAHSKETKKKISKALMGKKNPAYKTGRRSYRRIAGASKGEHIHHRDGNSDNNKPNNLVKFKENGPGRSKHEKSHKRNLNFSQKSKGRKTPKRGYNAKRLTKGKK